MLAGIIIKIKHKDGRVTEIKVPDDAQVEIVQEPPTPSKPKSANLKSQISNPKSEVPVDPDRAAAEWVLAQKPATGKGYFFNQVTVKLNANGQERKIARGEPLPEEPFRITQLKLHGAAITDNDLAMHLPKLTALWRLDLIHSPGITDAALPTFRNLMSVTSFAVAGTALSADACLELAKSLPIENLDLAPRQTTPELIDFICATPRIKYFGLNCSRSTPLVGAATDAQIRSLFRAKHLVRLNIKSAELEMETWRAIPDNFPNLTEFYAYGKSITDAHLAEFARFPKLTKLEVPNTSITDAGLPALHACQTLRHLDLTQTKVTAEGIATLHTALHSRTNPLSNFKQLPNRQPLASRTSSPSSQVNRSRMEGSVKPEHSKALECCGSTQPSIQEPNRFPTSNNSRTESRLPIERLLCHRESVVPKWRAPSSRSIPRPWSAVARHRSPFKNQDTFLFLEVNEPGAVSSSFVFAVIESPIFLKGGLRRAAALQDAKLHSTARGFDSADSQAAGCGVGAR